MTLDEKLFQALEDQARDAERLGLPTAKRLLRDAAQYGAAAALQNQLRRRRVSNVFDDLAQAGRLDLSPEALVVSKAFGPLFTDDEADFCLQALLEAGYYG